ncbi:MAG TPA: undecaprenyl-diphosphate phosphatase [Trueperaceae bacterium]|nr:undecaprenyl-diphosphate phosphatase [Trueperaceae bacterium]
MTLFQALVLGVVQGLTEFLPVSSSGHLVLANYYLGWGEGLALSVDIATNTGTLLAVLIYLRSDVLLAIGGFFGGLRSAEGRTKPGWRLGLLVLAGSVPTAIIGLALSGLFEKLNTPLPVAIALAITGLILWFAPKSGPKQEIKQVTFRDAIVGGVVQGIAVIPGISRSGSTISALLGRGLDKELAPKLSFLMYLVVSFGVALLGIREFDGSIGIAPLLVLMAASFAVGYAALFVVFSLLRRGKFRVFSPYLWALSAFTLVHLYLR